MALLLQPQPWIAHDATAGRGLWWEGSTGNRGGSSHTCEVDGDGRGRAITSSSVKTSTTPPRALWTSMSVPSMVHRSGDTLVVRSVVSGDQLFQEDSGGEEAPEEIEFSDELIDSGDDKDLPECKIKRNYSCTNCDYFTQNPRHFLYHLRDVHKEKVRIYECPNCLYASKHFQKLLRHMKMVHGSTEGAILPDFSRSKARRKRKVPVPEPVEEPEPEEEVEIPAEEDGVEEESAEIEESISKDLKCSLCPFTTRHQGQLTKHERQEHIKTKFFRCTKCTYVTHMKARFTKHVKYHSMPMIKCDLCDFRTPYKWNLDRHYKNHNGHGAFRCSACNFTADIKQSLTVHEMNHHVPPVGQAAGLSGGRRRNKVGASDSTAAEDAAREETDIQVTLTPAEPVASSADANKKLSPKLKISPSKKQKTANSQEQSERHNFNSDFIHPDDIIHHANGNVYIKNKCKLCSFKSAWDGEMAKHEKRAHNLVRENNKPPVAKKAARPIPNLIPIQTSPVTLSSLLKVPVRPGQSLLKVNESTNISPVMSQKDINDICAKSANSSLRDFASLFGSEDVFNSTANAEGDNPAKSPEVPEVSPPPAPKAATDAAATAFKQKNASFFDKLKEKLMTDAGESCNLTCKWCGHQSKCLSEHAGHQKTCGKQEHISFSNTPHIHNVSSTRCQYCRQRCKSSADLLNHLKVCKELQKLTVPPLLLAKQELPTISIKLENIAENCFADIQAPHPMENRVFVWNNIEQPMDEVQEIHYPDLKPKIEHDNVSLDLSIRTHSPGSENSYLGTEKVHSSGAVPAKIPSHGTNIDAAGGKRVFKCPHCSFWASTASRFHVHIVGHLNKKPFECSLCAYRSNWRWDITKHIRLKSVRDSAHEKAKVLMTDETGRRNYTKYNKYLTQMQIRDAPVADCGGGNNKKSKSTYEMSQGNISPSQLQLLPELPKLTRAPDSSDFSPLLRSSPLRPPPPLKAADGSLFQKKRPSTDTKKTLFKCKKCNFRDASRENILIHVKGHYKPDDSNSELETDEASVSKGQAPFRCGHCHQVSNWKHVIQRHCRLKHNGDVRVVIGGKNGATEKVEMDDQADEPDHVDLPQTGTFKCKQCPFSNNNHDEFEAHLDDHMPKASSIMKCYFCQFFVSQKEDLYEHLNLHGVPDPENYVARMQDKQISDNDGPSKRFRCVRCPYVSNSKSQFLYHKQFHRPRGGQYKCQHCNYNVTKRHLLHQHLRVHGINITQQKQSGDVIDLDDVVSDEIEEVLSSSALVDTQNFPDVPLVWVSKNNKFTKMFKCRYCPHVNLRKVNIQEHEKMHSIREKNPNKQCVGESNEHHCSECNYVCNNAGVLSSHSKVHQGLYGMIHCLVDTTKSDDEQIMELSRVLNSSYNQSSFSGYDAEEVTISEVNEAMEVLEDNPFESNSTESMVDFDPLLHFCDRCPARFLKETEVIIHKRFHGVRLFYKCEACTYTARQKPHLLSHLKVHQDDYQDKTKMLLTMYAVSKDNPQPRTAVVVEGPGVDSSMWVVIGCEKSSKTSELECKDLDSAILANKMIHSTLNSVPLSGTDLFQQKQNASAEKIILRPNDHFPPAPLSVDPQFGTLMHGNPKFIYPTYLKNGKMKEKRYKCHKCPSAFEKREQYKVHLSLHGSKQRYKCEHCDYSVKYYANYVQHMKKHQMNADAQAARKSGDFSDEQEDEAEDQIEESAPESGNYSKLAVKSISSKRGGPLKLSTADRQALMILQQRRASSSSDSIKELPPDDAKKTFWCPHCPYTNYRRDAVDNHVRRHVQISGKTNNYTCSHCDYSVPSSYFLKEHVKLHFLSNKMNVPEGFMICDKLKLVSKVAGPADSENAEENVVTDDAGDEAVVFEDGGSSRVNDRFMPELNSEVNASLNNNEEEKVFVNPETGEILENGIKTDENEDEDMDVDKVSKDFNEDQNDAIEISA